ncbi:Helix-turn-helix domain-containing protein [Evansella caseinilytica]|uniref:Helix-turn-helix domain-containing protein n=1 Tax=Evansella caseinilytica TaxID=1503961 RepID=A0A1H3U178_9BACI|nr:response regulator [Evansella caseinilytica]SDZ56173.1 Helix-turn-helix domain-containing protein [Evansella caseinilytica]
MNYWKTILIVDDEPKTRNGLKKTLEVWAASSGKAEVLCAASGKEALEILAEKKVHLLLTDIRMPEMSGLKLLRYLENQQHRPVVIIMSAYSEFEYAQEAIRLGVLNYLVKPISKQKLIEAVKKALEAVESREQSGLIKKVVDEQLLHINAKEGQTKAVIKTAMRYVDENLQEKLSLREVAEVVHLNPSYFSALFKEQTNVTFSEYVTRRRLEAAKNLLCTTDMTIAEVAEKVGYQTAKYFIKLFKEYERQTPSQYRREV